MVTNCNRKFVIFCGKLLKLCKLYDTIFIVKISNTGLVYSSKTNKRRKDDFMQFPISLHVIKRPIIPEVTLVLSTKREIENFEYETILMNEAIGLIELADERECRGKLLAVDASELIKELGFKEDFVRCHFTLVFGNDYNLNNFLNKLDGSK